MLLPPPRRRPSPPQQRHLRRHRQAVRVIVARPPPALPLPPPPPAAPTAMAVVAARVDLPRPRIVPRHPVALREAACPERHSRSLSAARAGTSMMTRSRFIAAFCICRRWITRPGSIWARALLG
ncbi:hypothetical protein IP70_18305 [alpha proteobacterium AAP38]|nr:hypothetical protein IP70_18305 [alpha proteobacterium AAP38]